MGRKNAAAKNLSSVPRFHGENSVVKKITYPWKKNQISAREKEFAPREKKLKKIKSARKRKMWAWKNWRMSQKVGMIFVLPLKKSKKKANKLSRALFIFKWKKENTV